MMNQNTLLSIFAVTVLGVIIFVSGVGDEVLVRSNDLNPELAQIGRNSGNAQSVLAHDLFLKLANQLSRDVQNLQSQVQDLGDAVGIENFETNGGSPETGGGIKVPPAGEGQGPPALCGADWKGSYCACMKTCRTISSEGGRGSIPKSAGPVTTTFPPTSHPSDCDEGKTYEPLPGGNLIECNTTQLWYPGGSVTGQ